MPDFSEAVRFLEGFGPWEVGEVSKARAESVVKGTDRSKGDDEFGRVIFVNAFYLGFLHAKEVLARAEKK